MTPSQLSITFFLQMFFILAVCRIVGWFSRKLGQPQVVGEMIAGVFLGPSLLGLVFPQAQGYGWTGRNLDAAVAALDDVAQNFALPGSWPDLDVTAVDFERFSGALLLPSSTLGLQFNEVEITYNAGLDPIPDEVKFACAQIVKNAQATPALNVRSEQIDSMRLEYFADALLDASVRTMLAPYVAQRLG